MTESFASQPWLTMVTFAPLVGALFIVAARMVAKKNADGLIEGDALAQLERSSKVIALGATVITFAISLLCLFAVRSFDRWFPACGAASVDRRRRLLQNGR